MSTTTLTGAILAAAPDQARPMLTYYNETSGERTELSGATLGNWAAKIGNYLRDEAGLLPGDEVRVDLPEHWQTAATLLGAWWAGAHVLLGDADGDARVVFTSRDRLDAHDVDEIVVVPLDPFAMGTPDLPIGVSDFGEAIRAHGDRFAPSGSGDRALDDKSVDEVLTAAPGAVGAGDRVLSVRSWRTADEVVANFAAPPLSGASLVYVDGTVDDERLERIGAAEKATAVWR